MKGKTAPVTLNAKNFNCYDNPMLKREVCGGDFDAVIDRTQWGIDYGLAYGFSKNVHLVIQVRSRQAITAFTAPKPPAAKLAAFLLWTREMAGKTRRLHGPRAFPTLPPQARAIPPKSNAQRSPSMKPFWSLLALAVGAFAIGTTEFAPMGLLPVIADGVQVSIPTAGMLNSAYAIGVMLGAPVMTLAFGRLQVKKALIALMAIFVLGNVLAALAPGYWTLFAARLVTSLNHGAFFGLGSVVAAKLVPQDKQASAVATMLMGLTIANVGGVPAATWVGQQIGWRMAFAGTAGLGLLAMAALAFALPPGEAGKMPDRAQGTARADTIRKCCWPWPRRDGLAAMFNLLYLCGADPHPRHRRLGRLRHRGADADRHRLHDRQLGRRAPGGLVAGRQRQAAAGRAGADHVRAAAVPAEPRRRRACPGGLGRGDLRHRAAGADAGDEAAGAPALASSVNVGAFNLGNALGAVVGGGVISAGWGYAALPVAGGLLAAAGLLLVYASAAKRRVVALDCA